MIVLNPVRTYVPGKLEDMVQIDKAQSSIRVMYQITLIGKALNQVIQQVNAMGAYRHIQTMTVVVPAPTLQAWLPLKEEPLPVDELDLNSIPDSQLLNKPLLSSKTSSKNEEEDKGQEHHPAAPGTTGGASVHVAAPGQQCSVSSPPSGATQLSSPPNILPSRAGAAGLEPGAVPPGVLTLPTGGTPGRML
eukprot:15348605-Ditylum_brightwellii.AAC.1